MTALVWRKELPDRPGWWWMKRGSGPLAYALPMQVMELQGRLQVHLPAAQHEREMGDLRPVEELAAQWAGPIPEPEEAKI